MGHGWITEMPGAPGETLYQRELFTKEETMRYSVGNLRSIEVVIKALLSLLVNINDIDGIQTAKPLGKHYDSGQTKFEYRNSRFSSPIPMFINDLECERDKIIDVRKQVLGDE